MIGARIGLGLLAALVGGAALAPAPSRRLVVKSGAPAAMAGALAPTGALALSESEEARKAARETEVVYVDGPRGLKYVVTKVGSGDKPVRGQSVKADYTLTLGGFADQGGRVVDSSKGFLKGPFAFYAGVGAVIKGWDLAVLDMKEGEARRLIVPAALGYGDKGAGGRIPGGATLYFEVELSGLGDPPALNTEQQAWLDSHPL